jgi:hypothetical protein
MSQSRLCRHILALLIVLLLAAASDGDPAGDTYNCQSEPSACGSLSVRYPFHVYNGAEDAPTEYGEPRSYCGYPGLAIHCDDDGEKPILRLGGDDYRVSNIDYTTLTVSLADADVAGDCPTVSHNVTIQNPFHLPASAVAYLFFLTDCTFPPDAEFAPKPLRKPPGIKPITCGTSSEAEPATSTTMSFVLPERDVPPKGEWWRACQSVHSAPVLRDAVPADAQSAAWRDGGYARALRGGFQVSWDRVTIGSGPCGRCEQSGGRCGYNGTGGFLGCLCANGAMAGGDGCGKMSDSAAPLSGKPFRSNHRGTLPFPVRGPSFPTECPDTVGHFASRFPCTPNEGIGSRASLIHAQNLTVTDGASRPARELSPSVFSKKKRRNI